MGYVTSATIAGYSRTDGTTARTVNMVRVGTVPNGFILREDLTTAPDQNLAQQLSHRTYEVRTKAGVITRHSSTEWRWPYDVPAAPGVVAGVVTLNRSGLHVPANCPSNVRKDIRLQMYSMATPLAGSAGLVLVFDPLVNGIIPA